MTIEKDYDAPTPDDPDEQPKALPAGRGDIDVPTPTASQLRAMFGDLEVGLTVEQSATAVIAAGPGAVDLFKTGKGIDTDDPAVRAALAVREFIATWWKTVLTSTGVIGAVVLAAGAGIVVTAAIGAYGLGWIGYTIWTTHGRPGIRDIAASRKRAA
ncbi:hypothetical protein [Nocardia sp. CA-120079]|uniref:hypothetical protein n=1 Tax=Nocardia sp. CA-120079 TaxID=3239974 RepID=UPI003D96DCA9